MWCLCDGAKDANELASDSSVLKEHQAATVADRLVYLARYGGTEHLVERDSGRYVLTEDGYAILC